MRVTLACMGFENQGVEALSAFLKAHGHEVALAFDPALFDDKLLFHEHRLKSLFDDPEPFAERVLATRPDVVGFSVFSINYPWGRERARRIKRRAPELPVVFGGIHPTLAPDAVMSEPAIDHVIVGEGESALLDLVEALGAGASPRALPNVWGRDADATVWSNPVRPYIRDLDALPLPDKDLFYDLDGSFARAFQTLSTRGCPYRCTFCCASHYHRLYDARDNPIRRRGVTTILREITHFRARHRVERVLFEDDVFGNDRAWLREFAALPARGRAALQGRDVSRVPRCRVGAAARRRRLLQARARRPDRQRSRAPPPGPPREESRPRGGGAALP
ncbi:MAG: cobalamin-dependent protein [Deltaproteobacteria bacterium]|nr:cobalamin-dependent protein [Deltaproteobacteria bacterium]